MLPLPLGSFGTPEVGFLYQRCATVYSVHRKAFSRTFSIPVKQQWPAIPGMQNYAHLKQLPFDRQQVGVPGVRIFAHLRVGVPGTERSIGVPDFQVRVVSRTWNASDLTTSELLFQV